MVRTLDLATPVPQMGVDRVRVVLVDRVVVVVRVSTAWPTVDLPAGRGVWIWGLVGLAYRSGVFAKYWLSEDENWYLTVRKTDDRMIGWMGAFCLVVGFRLVFGLVSVLGNVVGCWFGVWFV